jgi:hypothetical protein
VKVLHKNLCHWFFLCSATYPDRIALPISFSICGLGILNLEITVQGSHVACNRRNRLGADIKTADIIGTD